jgi:hypothetical protein
VGGACEEYLTNPHWKQVNAEIAHIKGERPKSPRYDPDQPDSERQGHGNLMLLCPKHHKLIDRLEPGDYPSAVLHEMKNRHLSHPGSKPWCGEAQLVEYARLAIRDALQAAAVWGEESTIGAATQPATARIAQPANQAVQASANRHSRR